MSETDALPIACTLTDPELARRAAAVREDLFAGAEGWEVLPDGYAIRFPGDAIWKERLDAFVTYERQCCAFLTFTLRFAPNAGPIWLSLTGPAGTKDFVRAQFLPEDA